MYILAAGSLELLKVNPGLVFWTVVTFSVVLIILWLFAWKPIIKALDARNDRIENDLKESRKLREDAENLLKVYEQKIENAKKEAMQLLEEGRKDAEENKDRILKEAREEAENIRDRIQHEISQAKLKALDELEKGAVELSVQLVSNVFKKSLTGTEHRSIIVKELEEIRKSAVKN